MALLSRSPGERVPDIVLWPLLALMIVLMSPYLFLWGLFELVHRWRLWRHRRRRGGYVNGGSS